MPQLIEVKPGTIIKETIQRVDRESEDGPNEIYYLIVQTQAYQRGVGGRAAEEPHAVGVKLRTGDDDPGTVVNFEGVYPHSNTIAHNEPMSIRTRQGLFGQMSDELKVKYDYEVVDTETDELVHQLLYQAAGRSFIDAISAIPLVEAEAQPY